MSIRIFFCDRPVSLGALAHRRTTDVRQSVIAILALCDSVQTQNVRVWPHNRDEAAMRVFGTAVYVG